LWLIAIIIIGGLIVLGILLLSIPFDISFRLEIGSEAHFNIKWSWLFGLIRRDLKKAKPGRQKKRSVRRRFDIAATLRSVRAGGEFFRINGLMQQFGRLMKRLFRSIRIRDLEVDFLVGLDDPAETFYLFSFTEPLNRLLSYVQSFPVSIHPSFIEPVFEGHAWGYLRLYPIRTVPPLLQFIFSPPGFGLIKKATAMRWKRKEP
jgi:hypothetical protein